MHPTPYPKHDPEMRRSLCISNIANEILKHQSRCVLYLLREMVKTLQDCCLACIARHISSYNRLGTFLSRLHKESLLERMCWHGQLTPERSPFVSYHVFSHVLKRVNLSYSTQVNDKTLDVLARSDCLPTSITVSDCPNVTGMRNFSKIPGQRRLIGLAVLDAG